MIGPVREVHAWTDRPIWPQAVDRPSDRLPVPKTLHWDLWLGPAPERPYHPAYHPFKWRGWWDFGTGALGDMGCHIIDVAFWALKLGTPRTVEAESPHLRDHPDTAPAWSIVRYEFPAQGNHPPVKLFWYDGGKLPPGDLFEDHVPTKGSNGSIFVGEKGRLLVGGDRTRGYRLLPERSVPGLRPSQTHSAQLARASCGVDRGLQDRQAHGNQLRLRRPAHRAGPAGQPRCRGPANRMGRAGHAVHQRT